MNNRLLQVGNGQTHEKNSQRTWKDIIENK